MRAIGKGTHSIEHVVVRAYTEQVRASRNVRAMVQSALQSCNFLGSTHIENFPLLSTSAEYSALSSRTFACPSCLMSVCRVNPSSHQVPCKPLTLTDIIPHNSSCDIGGEGGAHKGGSHERAQLHGGGTQGWLWRVRRGRPADRVVFVPS